MSGIFAERYAVQRAAGICERYAVQRAPVRVAQWFAELALGFTQCSPVRLAERPAVRVAQWRAVGVCVCTGWWCAGQFRGRGAAG